VIIQRHCIGNNILSPIGDQDEDVDEFRGTFYLAVELLSPGTNAFQGVTFNYIIPDLASEVAQEFYFEFGVLAFDANGNNTVFTTDSDFDEDALFAILGGSVEVIDNDNLNYTLMYDINLIQLNYDSVEPINGTQTSLSASVTYDFEYFDECVTSGRKVGNIFSLK